MANTLSTTKMTNPIRGLVSKRRIRYTQDGFDLDLTYINDRIIAMGYPAEHMESIYRNKIEDVQKMLEKNHAGCYKIYNLCSERSYNHKRFPYYSVYPFKDHNPPDIELITSFCRDVDEHLRADGKNVVAVHCKAGKGRTGTMICCYLLYSRQFNTAGEALHYYAQRRTSDSKGVTIPSQRRYVEYYATLLRSNETYRPVTLYICEIRLTPALSIKEGTINVTGNDPQSLPEFKRTDDHTAAKLDYCMPLAGDVKIEFVKSSVLRKEKRCHFWFNTYFVDKSARKDAEGNLLLVLSKSEIDDAHKDKHHKEYPNNFTVEVVLRRVPTGKYSESVSLKKCQPPVAVTTSPLIKCGMDNNRQQHIPSQQILLQQQQQQQHQSPLQHQQQQQHPPLHRQMSSDPYRPTIIKHQNSYIDGNTNPVVSGGFLHDQHHHQQQQQNSLPTHQNNHHNHQHHHPHHHHHHHQLQQLPTQQQELNYQSMHENNQQYLDENNHCLEYSETSSSESSTEEEGWDSGNAVSSIRRHHLTTINTNNADASNCNDGGSTVGQSTNGNNHQSHSHQHHHHRHHHHRYDDDPSVVNPANSHHHKPITDSPAVSRAATLVAVESKLTTSPKSPIKKSASAVETAVTNAASKLNNKLRRMSSNAIFTFSAHNSNNTNCKSQNKPSTSSSVSGSSNKCDMFSLLSQSDAQQQQRLSTAIGSNGKVSNPSSPTRTTPMKPVGRSISNDPTTVGSHPRRDSLPLIGGLLSSFSSSSVSSSNSSSLSSSTFGTGSANHGPSSLQQQKHSKLHALFSVSSCYNGSSDNDTTSSSAKRRGSRGGDGDDDPNNADIDEDDNDRDEHDDQDYCGHRNAAGSLRRGGCGKCDDAGNSDSGRCSTEIVVPEIGGTGRSTTNGVFKDVV